MTEWPQTHDGARPKVLDVGTGSGYQAAILAALGAQVVSIELEAELAERARLRLIGLGYDVKVVAGDGSGACPTRRRSPRSWSPPRRRTCPQPLVEQLLPDGAAGRAHRQPLRAGDHARPADADGFVARTAGAGGIRAAAGRAWLQRAADMLGSPMTHVFVSPHPDDIALSCGGLSPACASLARA